MTEPSKFNDDEWADLVRDLDAIATPSPPKPADLHPAEEAEEPSESEEPPVPGGTEPLDEEEDVTVAEGEGEGGEGAPGTGRKRRRRRRRRRKGGQAAESVGADEAEGDKEEEEEEGPADAYESAATDSGFVEEQADDMEEAKEPDDGAEEDAGGELLRELIAKWNVPSWDEVVGGLYRP